MALKILILLTVTLARSSGQAYEYSAVNEWWQSFPNCGGSYQSPINIVTASAVYNASLTGLNVNYNVPTNTSYLIINNGHSVQVKLQGISTSVGISGGGLPVSYALNQFHFHWGNASGHGSEHTIDGVAHDMEMHLVHYNPSYSYGVAANTTNGLAVLGVFIQVSGGDNPVFQMLINYFQNITYKGQNVTVSEFPITQLLPIDYTDFYRYSGSLTTPYCYESVIWTVLRYPINISLAQMTKFRTALYELSFNANDTENELLVNDYRPVQPLNGRTVWTSYSDINYSATSSVSTLAMTPPSSPSTHTNHAGILHAGRTLLAAISLLLLTSNFL